MAENYAPFKAHLENSVKAHGKVSGIQVHPDGKTAEVTVRHEAPKKPNDGKEINGLGPISAHPYPHETRAVMPAKHAQRFAAGDHVAVHIGPADEIGDTEDEGGEQETDKKSTLDEGDKPKSAQGPKQASGDIIRKAAAKKY